MKIAVKYKIGENIEIKTMDKIKAMKYLKKKAKGEFRLEDGEITMIFEADHDAYVFLKELGVRAYLVK